MEYVQVPPRLFGNPPTPVACGWFGCCDDLPRVVLYVGCVHEHLIDVPFCERHAKVASSTAETKGGGHCGPCSDLGHICDVMILRTIPIEEWVPDGR